MADNQTSQGQQSSVARPEQVARRLIDLTMEEANIDASNAAFRRGATVRRPGEASRQPIDRPSDVEAGLNRGVQFNTPAGTGSGGANAAMLGRKRTLVRPERRRVEPTDRNYHYLYHTQAQNMPVQASTTGNRANVPIDEYDEDDEGRDVSYSDNYDPESPIPSPSRTDLMRGKSILGRDAPQRVPLKPVDPSVPRQRLKKGRTGTIKRKPKEPERDMTTWVFYCRTITCCFPGSLLRCFGIPGRMQQQAWREKIGLLSVIILLGAFVGFLTFGFTQAVCTIAPTSFNINQITNGYLIINGRAYDLTRSSHPPAIGVPAKSNVLYPPVNAGGLDASFMFQNVNSKCKGLITARSGSNILTDSNGNLGWYFPCAQLFKPDGSTPVNHSEGAYTGYACHTTSTARNKYYGLKVEGEVVFDWDDIKNSSRNLMVYSGDVLDLNLLRWLDPTKVNYPSQFDDLRNGALNSQVRGVDVTHFLSRINDKAMGQCLAEIIKVGTVDTTTVGCLASRVVLYVSLVFIIGIVMAKFVMALWFHWFLSWRLGSYTSASKNPNRQHEIEEWSDDIYRPAPNLPTIRAPAAAERPKSSFFPRTSRFTQTRSQLDGGDRPTTGYKANDRRSRHGTRQNSMSNLLSTPSLYGDSASTHSMYFDETPRLSTFMPDEDSEAGPSGFIHESVVPQPPPEYTPFGYPLAHVLCLVTTYNESAPGLRTTFDSIATSDYPNSHKLLFVICDGNIKGAGESKTTPDYVVSMMKDHAVPPKEVEAFSYVAIANGYKRHNMAKVYAGFYEYDDATVPPEKQQRVPMICIAKCGTPREIEADSKPGNRGKRDSQIILMGFLQKVLFDERMTELEFEIFNGIWKITGLSPDVYDDVLMVDADTKIFPDAITCMVAAMVKDDNVMGLCGETKIANKSASWVSMIQAFESVFGGVTCLPGCFSMYRIKAPKGEAGYFVPILANPDVVSRYQEDQVDTLHKKNLLLLGEDRYLSTLMLKTFPRRKQIFVPQAVCKTVVPESFKVLLSQRRRWINSTVHNLMELFLVKDLCGTFCFSMQFVVFIELVGTCVLPAALGFTIYVIVIAIVSRPVPIIPLTLLALILGLPAVLIVLTAKRWSYVGWMFIYLGSIMVWNFVLPVYAFWNFDDFSWGDTRRVEGELKGGHHGEEGEFDSSQIVMKRWAEFERDRRRKQLATSTYEYPGHIPSGARSPSRPSSSREPPSTRGYDAGYL